jgi:hypothetical protein
MNSKEKTLLLISIGCLVAWYAEVPDVAHWSASTPSALKALPPQSGTGAFRHAAYSDEQFWTNITRAKAWANGKLQTREVISSSVSPQTVVEGASTTSALARHLR